MLIRNIIKYILQGVFVINYEMIIFQNKKLHSIKFHQINLIKMSSKLSF